MRCSSAQYIHAKHVTSGRPLSGIPAAHTILRLRCHFCPLCFPSCSEQRLWDEGHLFWQQGQSAPLRLSYSTAFNSAPLWLTSLLGRAFSCSLCLRVCVWGRLLKILIFQRHRASTAAVLACTCRGRRRCRSPALLTWLCLGFFCFFSYARSVNVPH